MAEVLSMIGHVKDTTRVLRRAYDERQAYGRQLVEFFASHDIRKAYFVGSGTSHNASLVIRDMFMDIAGIEGVACEPTIFAYHEDVNPNGIYRKDQIVVFGLSQHGDSSSTCAAIKAAKAQGLFTIGVTEDLTSYITTISDMPLHLVCGREEIGPETRGYTETLMQFYILAIEIARAKGRIDKARYEKLDDDARQLIANFDAVISESIAWFERNQEELVKMYKSSIAGYGINFPTAQEGRLKLMETFGQPCMYYEMEEQMHGPLRAYGPDNYMFVIGSEGKQEYARFLTLIPYFKEAFTQHVFVVTAEKYEGTAKDLVFTVHTTDVLSPIMYVVTFQVLAALLCEKIGKDTKVSPIKNKRLSGHMTH